MMPPDSFTAMYGILPLCKQSSDLYYTVSFLWTLAKPAGHIITGVQKTSFLSRTMTLLALSGAFAAADATDPTSMLLVSLMTERLLESAFDF